jgi:hypothetical protein
MISSCTVESTRTITATLSPCLGSALIVFIDDSFFFPFLTISHRFACVTKVRRHINRDQSGFAIFCLIEKSCEEAANLPDPDVLAQEIVDDLEAALEQFREIATDLADKPAEKDR